MHDDISGELELLVTEAHAQLHVCCFAWRAPDSADRMEESRRLRFPRPRLASIFTSHHTHITTTKHCIPTPAATLRLILRHTQTIAFALSRFAHRVSFSLVMGLAALSRARLFESL